jgi:hypothetical protein
LKKRTQIVTTGGAGAAYSNKLVRDGESNENGKIWP